MQLPTQRQPPSSTAIHLPPPTHTLSRILPSSLPTTLPLLPSTLSLCSPLPAPLCELFAAGPAVEVGGAAGVDHAGGVLVLADVADSAGNSDPAGGEVKGRGGREFREGEGGEVEVAWGGKMRKDEGKRELEGRREFGRIQKIGPTPGSFLACSRHVFLFPSPCPLLTSRASPRGRGLLP
jgi:hypothetical protein